MEDKVDPPQKTDAQKRREELTEVLRIKYPFQKFGAATSYNTSGIITEGEELDIAMWANVFALAKKGQFDRIRPDIVVNNFDNLVSIQSFYEESQGDAKEEDD